MLAIYLTIPTSNWWPTWAISINGQWNTVFHMHAGVLDPIGGRDFHMWLPLGGAEISGFPHVGKGISKLLGAAGARDFHWKFPTHSIRGGWGSQLITA